MVSLTALWLPILLSAVIVFIASHKNDYRKLPDEEKCSMLCAPRA
jgi:hypothetical protein